MSEDFLENGPESTHVEQAFEDLHSNDPDKRSSAIEMLVATPLSTMAATPLPILLTALDDKNARVRKVATTALGLKGDIAAIPRLMNLLQDKWVRETAVRALGQIGLPALLPILQGKDVVLRRVAVTTLGTTGDATAIPELLDALMDEDETVRQAAAQSLSIIGDASTAPTLIKALADKERLVSDAAKEALVKMGVPGTKALVIALNDKDRTIRTATSNILALFPVQIAFPELLNALLNKDKQVRRAAAKVLGAKDYAKANSSLFHILDDEENIVHEEEEDIARVAAEVIGAEDHAKANSSLLGMLDDKEDIVRAAAAKALGILRNTSAIPKLSDLLNDRKSMVRMAAAEALGRLNDKSRIPELLAALDDPFGMVREEAINALAIIGDITAIPRLLTVLRDSDSRLRYYAARALGRIGDTLPVPALLDVLQHDPDVKVRAAAAIALGRIGDVRAIAVLAELLPDPKWWPPPPGVNYELGEGALLDRAAEEALNKVGKLIGEKTILFSVYYPKEVAPKIWYPLHLYCYLITAAREIIADARIQLSGSTDQYRQQSEQAQRFIDEGAMITATPSLNGFQFNPPDITIGFYEEWHRLDFKLRASDEWLEKASNGFVKLTVEGVIVADIPLSIYVGEQGLGADTPTMTYKPYQAIFCSYSHRDEQIVRRVERAYKALGMDYLRDITTLKSGQFWNEELLAMIERADIFQLFWSKDSASSQNVEKEWKHALQLDREQSRFIRPVYWIQPMPSAPKELAHIHFSYDPDLGT